MLAGAVVVRAWVAAALAVLVLACHMLWLAPRLTAEPAGAEPAVRLRVMTLNLFVGQADPDAVVATVRAERPDLLALQELTSDALDQLERAGLHTLLPYQVAVPGGVAGTGIYARVPLQPDGVPDDRTTYANPRATLRLGEREVRVPAVHPAPPLPESVGLWRRDLRALRDDAAATDGPRVVLGDFNATADHDAFRDLLGTGLRDAHEMRGRGLAPTWPAHRRVPPCLQLDHVLVSRELTVLAVGERTISGTDHRG